MATFKQKEVFKEVLKGTTITQAMKKAKYADSTSKTTGKITRSKGWKELTDKFLPDKDLIKVHREGLSATKVISANITYGEADEKTNDFIDVPDYIARHKYLETAYQLKGKYPKEKGEELNQPVIVNIIKVTQNGMDRAQISSKTLPTSDPQGV